MEPMGNYEKCTIGLSTGPGVVIQKLTQAKAAGKSVAKSEGVGHRSSFPCSTSKSSRLKAYVEYSSSPFGSLCSFSIRDLRKKALSKHFTNLLT